MRSASSLQLSSSFHVMASHARQIAKSVIGSHCQLSAMFTWMSECHQCGSLCHGDRRQEFLRCYVEQATWLQRYRDRLRCKQFTFIDGKFNASILEPCAVIDEQVCLIVVETTILAFDQVFDMRFPSCGAASVQEYGGHSG